MSAYIPLKEKIEPYLKSKFNDLPEQIKSRIKKVDPHDLWDKVREDYLTLLKEEANKEKIAELEQVFLDRRMMLIEKYEFLNDPSREHERRQYDKLEDQYFVLELFNNIRNEYDYWASRPVLLAEEAIPLMHGVDPTSWQEHLRNEKGLPDDMVQSIKRHLKIAENIGLNQANPVEWIEWGREHKLNERTLKPDYTMDIGEACLWHLFEDAVNRLLVDNTEATIESESETVDCDDELAALFDPVSHEALNAMFPSEGWARWHRKAKECGLATARQGRGKYNPYSAAKWWIDTHKPRGWEWSRCLRKLANNLPARSRGSEQLLTSHD
jgi:hypothetical protein